MNEEEIDGVLGELQRLVGMPLSNVWQPARDRVVLGWRDGTLLVIVPRGPLARLHTIASRPTNPARPFSFQGACRARLQGPCTSMGRAPTERIVRLAFASGALELRLTGRSGGLWLLDDEGRVVASLEGPAPEALPDLPERGVSRGTTRFRPEGDQTWNDAAERWFAAEERRRREKELRGRLERSLARAIQHHVRLLENLGRDLERAEAGPEVRHRADLLTANLWRCERGTRVVDVEDWETGQTVTLTLPDDLGSPQNVAQRWFQQARRLERMGDHVLQRMDGVERELRELRVRAERLDELPLEELVRLERSLPRDERRSGPAPSLPWEEWTGPGGLRIRVGRNEAGNRRLVFQASKGHDWWMHLKDRPSAHVVLSVAKGASPSLPHLLAGAQLLLQRAGMGDGEGAEVQYARVRDLRSVPGGGATVTVSEERVLRATRRASELSGWAPA
ncbi:MAG: NFACT family protein [Alphaproteobacteria bacterium]|nr:NFACT family protein [Alphaproteobacteria bacterium]